MKRLILMSWLSVAALVLPGRAEDAGSAHGGHGAHGGMAMSAPGGERLSGKVVETMNTSGYTYVLVNTGTNKAWAAAPQFAVKVGDTVAIGDSMPMPNYHSKSLNRDFDVVYFASQISVNGAGGAAMGGMAELPKGHPPINGKAAGSKIDFTGIQKAKGGVTVAQIWADKAKLTGKQVKVRGKVTKFNSMIMGKNWIHIGDGTGSEGSNDLLITSQDTVKLGDTILVTGAVATNKDFGANYKYTVMIEDAKVTVE